MTSYQERERDVERARYLRNRSAFAAMAVRLLNRYEERVRAAQIDEAIAAAIEMRGATTEQVIAAISALGRENHASGDADDTKRERPSVKPAPPRPPWWRPW